jgi:hypothetical protein
VADVNQQVNLYQPIFREERKLFSLKAVLVALGIVSASLVLMWALGVRNVDALQQGVAQLQSQQAAQERMAQAAGILLDEQGSPVVVQAEVQSLSAQLAEKTQALSLLRSGAAGESKGFAPRLAALARQHVDGVWLDHLVLSSGAHGLILRGRGTDAELIPQYLQLLTREPELVGARFDEVELDRRAEHEPNALSAAQDKRDSATVRFSVASQALRTNVKGATNERHGT